MSTVSESVQFPAIPPSLLACPAACCFCQRFTSSGEGVSVSRGKSASLAATCVNTIGWPTVLRALQRTPEPSVNVAAKYPLSSTRISSTGPRSSLPTATQALCSASRTVTFDEVQWISCGKRIFNPFHPTERTVPEALPASTKVPFALTSPSRSNGSLAYEALDKSNPLALSTKSGMMRPSSCRLETRLKWETVDFM